MLRTVSLPLLAALLAGCVAEYARQDDPRFPLEPHDIFPVWWSSNGGQIAAGVVTDSTRALEQPLQFSHYLHASKTEMQCEYCHSAARKSIHGGVPELQTCMNCHKFVKTNSPLIKTVKEHYDAGTPLPWNKVHDAPDYVNFAHNRHVRAGVECTECHGQIQLQGQPQLVKKRVDDGHGHTTEVEVLEVSTVMQRETTLQMGWCLDCHASHPSIDTNYGEKADLRRAELKDCWTCHK